MKLRKLFKNKLAFTLVELVVVIAIMAILAGTVAGAVVGIRNNANNTKVKSAAEDFNSAFVLYLSGANDDSLPSGAKKYSPSLSNTDMATTLGKIITGASFGTVARPESTEGVYVQLPTKPTNGWTVTDTSKAQNYTIIVSTENRSVTLTYSSFNTTGYTSMSKPS